MRNTTYTCNKCGKSFDEYDKSNGASMYTIAGYGSKYDGEEILIDLCCDCMDKLIESCIIYPGCTQNG